MARGGDISCKSHLCQSGDNSDESGDDDGDESGNDSNESCDDSDESGDDSDESGDDISHGEKCLDPPQELLTVGC